MIKDWVIRVIEVVLGIHGGDSLEKPNNLPWLLFVLVGLILLYLYSD